MTIVLSNLIKAARTELGSDACRQGNHLWVSDGGRSCPHDLDPRCSQVVYQCSVCGTYDYGELGGPGDACCLSSCKHREEYVYETRSRREDPLGYHPNGWLATFNRVARHQRILKRLKQQPTPRLPK